MQVIRGWRDVPATAQGAVLALGNFDGVHGGHRAVLNAAVEIADRTGKPSGAVIFEPHPREFFAAGAPFFRLTPLDVKLELLEELGLDEVVVLDFDADLASHTADAFARDVIAGALRASHIVVGYDFTFGKGRTGSAETLKALGRELGFEVDVVAPVGEGDGILSSSKVRDLLRQGEMRKAAKILGYWWRVRGTVGHGAGRGKGLGFPTLNLALARGQELAHGIYAVRVLVDGKRYDAAGYIGNRPTFGGDAPVFEAYLFDFEGDLYGKSVEVEFIERIRGDQAFETPEALSEQMARDCEAVAAILKTAPESPD